MAKPRGGYCGRLVSRCSLVADDAGGGSACSLSGEAGLVASGSSSPCSAFLKPRIALPRSGPILASLPVPKISSTTTSRMIQCQKLSNPNMGNLWGAKERRQGTRPLWNQRINYGAVYSSGGLKDVRTVLTPMSAARPTG